MYDQRRTGEGEPWPKPRNGFGHRTLHRILTQGDDSFRRAKGGPETVLAEGDDS